MFWVSTKRIFRSGYINFKRNGIVSLASVLMMTITLCVLASLIFLQAALDFSLGQIKDNVDITVYFSTSASESKILSLKNTIEKLPEVAATEYIEKEQSLALFKERHANDFLTLQALDELDDNPLGATLTIKAKDPSQYETISNLLDGESDLAKENASIIDRINYHQNKVVIDRLNGLVAGTERLGVAITIALALVSMLITFITIRLTIYIAREEISVMRLVGAANRYINGPFIVEGIICGVIAAALTMLIYWPVTYVLHDTLVGFLGIDLFDYFTSNLFQLFGLLLLTGVIMSSIASSIAVRRYLRK